MGVGFLGEEWGAFKASLAGGTVVQGPLERAVEGKRWRTQTGPSDRMYRVPHFQGAHTDFPSPRRPPQLPGEGGHLCFSLYWQQLPTRAGGLDHSLALPPSPGKWLNLPHVKGGQAIPLKHRGPALPPREPLARGAPRLLLWAVSVPPHDGVNLTTSVGEERHTLHCVAHQPQTSCPSASGTLQGLVGGDDRARKAQHLVLT